MDRSAIKLLSEQSVIKHGTHLRADIEWQLQTTRDDGKQSTGRLHCMQSYTPHARQQMLIGDQRATAAGAAGPRVSQLNTEYVRVH